MPSLEPSQAEVPLADAGGGVALVLEQARDGEPARLDERRRAALQHAALQRTAPGVAAGQDAVARGRADGRGTMGVGEDHAFARQAVEVRRADFGFRVEAAQVAVAEVVGEDEDDVGPRGGSGERGGRGAQFQEIAS